MHITIKHPDDSRTAFFGVNDFSVSGDGKINLYLYREIRDNEPEQQRTIDGKIVSAVCETAYDEQGAYETVGDLTAEDGMAIIAGTSDRHPSVKKAVTRLVEEDSFADTAIEILTANEE